VTQRARNLLELDQRRIDDPQEVRRILELLNKKQQSEAQPLDQLAQLLTEGVTTEGVTQPPGVAQTSQATSLAPPSNLSVAQRNPTLDTAVAVSESSAAAPTDQPERTVYGQQQLGNSDWLKNLGTINLPRQVPVSFDQQPDVDTTGPLINQSEANTGRAGTQEFVGPRQTEELPGEFLNRSERQGYSPLNLELQPDLPITDEPDPTVDSSTSETGLLHQMFGGENDKGFRLLQVLGKLGEGIAANRAVGSANKQNRRSQAGANLINALSPGAGARGSRNDPKLGVLGQLAGGVSAAGSAGLEAKAAGRAEEDRQKAFTQQETENTNRQRELDILDRRATSGETTAQAGLLTAQTRGANSGIALSQGGVEALARTIRDRLGNESFSSSTEITDALSPEERETFESLNPSKQIEVLYEIISPKEGAGEGEKLMEKATFIFSVDELEKQWDKASVKGWKAGVGGLFFDLGDDEGFIDNWARRQVPDSADLVDQLSGMGLTIAKQLQGTRASNLDLKMAARALPRITDSDELAKKKFDLIRRVATGDYGRILGLNSDGSLNLVGDPPVSAPGGPGGDSSGARVYDGTGGQEAGGNSGNTLPRPGDVGLSVEVKKNPNVTTHSNLGDAGIGFSLTNNNESGTWQWSPEALSSLKFSFGEINPGSDISKENKNPFNIRYVGQETSPQPGQVRNEFAIFPTLEDGVAEGYRQIALDSEGKGLDPRTGLEKKPLTLGEFLHKFAPKTDRNDTEAYIAHMMQRTGAKADTLLADIDHWELGKAMMLHESNSTMSGRG